MTEWKLCKDELPETEDEVLTTYIVNGDPKKRFVETASYFNDGDGYGHWNSVWDEYRVSGTKTEVIAWMPLPKPYKGSETKMSWRDDPVTEKQEQMIATIEENAYMNDAFIPPFHDNTKGEASDYIGNYIYACHLSAYNPHEDAGDRI